ncbi:MAG: DUF4124 domain-containing protein [bacterium]
MLIRQSYFFILISGGLLLFPCLHHAEEYYRWKDGAGNVQYSFTRPAGAEYIILDQAGRHLNTITKPDESATNNAHPQSTTHNASGEKVALHKTTQQDSAQPLAQLSTYDKFLLASYLDVAELAQAHTKKIKRLAIQVENYKKSRQKLSKKIQETEQILASTTQAEAKEKLHVYLENTQNIVQVYSRNITKNEQKIADQEAQYLTDKLRLTALLALKQSAKSSQQPSQQSSE